jgi:hypothetical protein
MEKLRQLDIREIWVRRISRWFWRIVFVFISAWAVQVAWAYSLSPVFKLREITMQEAFAFLILSRALAGFPEVSRTLHRAWLGDQLINLEAFMQQLFIYYMNPMRERFSKEQQEEADSNKPQTTR